MHHITSLLLRVLGRGQKHTTLKRTCNIAWAGVDLQPDLPSPITHVLSPQIGRCATHLLQLTTLRTLDISFNSLGGCTNASDWLAPMLRFRLEADCAV